MNNKLNDIYPKDTDVLLYQNNHTLLLFKYVGRVPSGFVKVDKDNHLLLAGRSPVGLDQSNLIINNTLVDIFTEEDLHDYVDIPFGDFIYRLYRDADQYQANDGLSPNRIVEALHFNNYTCLKLTKSDMRDKDLKNVLIPHSGTYIQKVEEFMTTFQQPVIDKPSIMPEDRNKLRIALIFEELSEYAEASGLSDYFSELCIHSAAKFNKDPDLTYVPVIDLVEQFDALLDMQYVLSGAVIENGFKDIFDKGFDEVHRSNMSKACDTEDEAIKTLQFHKVTGTYKEDNGKFLCYNEDKKVLKSINYSPANLLLIIEDGQRQT